jgi:hypothetical protein
VDARLVLPQGEIWTHAFIRKAVSVRFVEELFGVQGVKMGKKGVKIAEVSHPWDTLMKLLVRKEV